MTAVSPKRETITRTGSARRKQAGHDQSVSEHQASSVVTGPFVAPPIVDTSPNGDPAAQPLDLAHSLPELHRSSGAVENGGVERDHRCNESQTTTVALDPLPFLQLRILAECYFDTQQNRISCVNRMERGGVAPELFAGQIDALVQAEHAIELALVRNYRRLVRDLLPGVDAWQKREAGIGEKLLARLLGHLGHPRVAFPYHWSGVGSARVLVSDPPYARSLAQLRAYCGHGDPARRKTKGMSAEQAFGLGSPQLKMILHLLAEASMKRQLPDDLRTSPIAESTSNGRAAGRSTSDYTYRRLYEARRLDTAERVHAGACIRCGPSGKPAQPGSPWSPGHQHADALRVVGKQILKDLWLSANHVQ